MADIQLIQCKNQQKTSSYRRNSVPNKEIGIKESNDDVRITLNHPFAAMMRLMSDCFDHLLSLDSRTDSQSLSSRVLCCGHSTQYRHL